eukprot:TRINITY_DN7090_c0_g1_i2.p1 TRINITY_DN7090_c0_g1~~TRINITY_DN7090_c0_g1_i2.p1  ORF type:complete len:131 (+),score=25.16 TRINITY_DN7090_c0_g1_i2:429-821(+)
MSLSSKCFSLVLARWKEQEKINVLRAHGIYVESHNLEGNTSKSCSSFLFRLYDMLELQTLEGFQDRQLCVDVWYQSIKEGKMEFSWKEFLDAMGSVGIVPDQALFGNNGFPISFFFFFLQNPENYGGGIP